MSLKLFIFTKKKKERKIDIFCEKELCFRRFGIHENMSRASYTIKKTLEWNNEAIAVLLTQ